MENKQLRSISNYNTELKLKGFNAYQIDADTNTIRQYSRKDFFKICVTTGKSIIHYADRSYVMDGTILFFGNPHIPYSWETVSRYCVGYSCLFSEDFLQPIYRSDSLLQSPFFRLGGTPILSIAQEQRAVLDDIFLKMIAEQQSNYPYRDDLIRNYLQLIIHEALKMQPSENFTQDKNATARITRVFMELLERQFPIESPEAPLTLRTAQDYANNLSIHVNHLNRSLKKVTGKSTTTLINERIIMEAKAILQHTDWNIAEVAYSLGFEYPTYFNNFFKRMTGTNPKSLRSE